ncbi:MAG: hypothetical protein H7A51_06885 [Akkermansiaceae bacterium]|nr:hypothetical protein [Akkermansiaceae bacterium]
MIHPINLHTRSLPFLAIVGLAPCAWAEPAAPGTTDAPENKVAPESETSVKPARQEPVVKKISPSTYQIGKIKLNKDTREITIPAQTNITDPGTVLEYLLVHVNGEKVHEALLVTEADPTHVNIALKLLNYKESPELFRELKADGTPSENYPVVADEIKKAARFGIFITWNQGGKEKTFPITDWLQHRILKKPMPHTPWVYNGSYVHHQKFKAKLTGNIFTIFPDEGSIANYPGKDRDDDTLWFPAPRIPAEGTALTVTLKPWAAAP